MKTEVHAPEGGWKPRTWYLVDVSYFVGNPVHRSLFFTGFLQDGKPCGYNCLIPLHGIHDEWPKEWTEVRYLKAIREVISEDEAEKVTPTAFRE